MNNIKNNLFLDFQQKKEQVCKLAKLALDAGWLDKKYYQEIISKIQQDTLTIGVIGQMKCGKSTFLNSFLFGKQLLPAATTPMTAALSVITYGEKKGIEVEFYTSDEWNELKTLSKRDENEINDSQIKSSIKAAKELYDKSRCISSQLPKLLGTKKQDSIDNLIEYVGSNGRYVSIVKSVRINLPEEWLKGVEIVDTPGFNDPVVSREERTKDFLKRADVVVMMLYAGRAFDAIDRDILLEKVRKVGIGKVILSVNKYDIQLAQGESPQTIKENVIEELERAIREHNDESVSELLSNLDPILISAQLALLSKMSLSEINSNEDLSYHYNKACDDFELTSQAQLLKLSNIQELDIKVKDIITNQKENILVRKPINQILQVIKNQLNEVENELVQLNENKKNLEIPDESLDKRIHSLERAQRRIKRKINRAEQDLEEEYDEISNKVFDDIQDLVYRVKSECEHIINTYRQENLFRRLNSRLDRFQNVDFPRVTKQADSKIKRGLRTSIDNLSEDVADVICKYLEDSYELAEDFRCTIIGSISTSVNNTNAKSINDTDPNSTEDDSSFIGDFLEVLTLPLWAPTALLDSLLSSGRDEATDYLNKFFDKFDWEEINSQLACGKKDFINTLNGEAAKRLINNLVEEANKAKGTKEEKENKLIAVKKEIEVVENKKANLEKNLQEFKSYINI